MAIYHMSVSAHSRSKGHSATAAAAYRACERIVDERTGEIHDYRRKGGLVVAELFTPPGVSWSGSRADLWNAAERAETYKNACVAREHLVALPHELDEGQRLELVREYARDLAQRHGCAVDAAIHDADEGGNVHAHVLCSTRVLTADGFGEKCAREQAGRKRSADLKAERIRWEVLANGALERAGRPERIDHRSHKERGLLDLPTIHEGHGPGRARRAQHNREVSELNEAMRAALTERAHEAARLKAAEAEAFARARAEAAEEAAAQRAAAELAARYEAQEARQRAAAVRVLEQASTRPAVRPAPPQPAPAPQPTRAELEARLAAINKERHALEARAASLLVGASNAPREAAVRQARASLPQLTARTGKALKDAQRLQAQAKATPWWAPFRARRLERQAIEAKQAAQRAQDTLRATKSVAGSTPLEQLQRGRLEALKRAEELAKEATSVAGQVQQAKEREAEAVRARFRAEAQAKAPHQPGPAAPDQDDGDRYERPRMR